MNVPGEEEYIGRGVAFCPHCDGPFYKGKRVAVVGGGNSGIEAAIDLAGICSNVIVFEFLDELKADKVLQEKAKSMPNIDIFTDSQTTEVIGNGEKMTGIRVKDHRTGEERIVELDGIFVQIGLAPNTLPFREYLDTNRGGEIVIDSYCRTNVPGVYAAEMYLPCLSSKLSLRWVREQKLLLRPLKIVYGESSDQNREKDSYKRFLGTKDFRGIL